MEALTLEHAKRLVRGEILHQDDGTNADGTCVRWKVNGAVRTWKRDPGRVAIPVKFGLRSYDTITESSLARVHVPEPGFTWGRCPALTPG